tara:strand:- start:452 stop:928 length:477 start_codon:yes stop_codon:yes gene_type:complete
VGVWYDNFYIGIVSLVEMDSSRVKELGGILRDTHIVVKHEMVNAGEVGEFDKCDGEKVERCNFKKYNYVEGDVDDTEEFVHSQKERREAYEELRRIKKTSGDLEVRRECKQHLRYVSKPLTTEEEESKFLRNCGVAVGILGGGFFGWVGYEIYSGKKG